MKMQVDIQVNGCPHCEEHLKDEIYQFWLEGDYPQNFDFECPYCNNVFDIEVERLPSFLCSKNEATNDR